jgi:hypothetical protein
MKLFNDQRPRLNRNAVVVVPKVAFLNWLRRIDPDAGMLTLADLTKDPAIYLLRECEDEKQFLACLGEVSSRIFEEELDAWWTEESDWPTNRTFSEFCRWFDYQYCSELIDLSAEALLED